jgi:hypothetical protein
MSAFNQGLMTGAQLGQGAYRQRQAREVGGLMSSGDYTGAASAAYGQGDLQGGQAITTLGRAEDTRTRGQNITGALRTGDYTGAMNFASSPEELAAITEFKNTASAAEIAQTAQRATALASVLESIEGLPPEQQLAAAQAAAPQFGIDPATLTPDRLTPQSLRALRIQAMGYADFLSYEQEEQKLQRPFAAGGVVFGPPGSDPQALVGGGQPEYVDAPPPGARPVNPNQPAPGQPVRATSEMSQPSRVSFQNSGAARQAIASLVPGVGFNSGYRTPQRQRELIAEWERGGRRGVRPATNSNHNRDRAWDLDPPAGMSTAQLAQRMRSEGFRALDEGDHVHVSW